jgi:hypothetical protein
MPSQIRACIELASTLLAKHRPASLHIPFVADYILRTGAGSNAAQQVRPVEKLAKGFLLAIGLLICLAAFTGLSVALAVYLLR